MADESTPQEVTGPPTADQIDPVRPRYDWLRWAIRITGIVLMLGGTLYLAAMAAKLLTDPKSDTVFVVIASLIALGLGILILRIGYNMLRSINPQTIASFSFVFALVYTSILVQILPAAGPANEHPILLSLGVLFCFAVSYWILRSILLHLLLPRNQR